MRTPPDLRSLLILGLLGLITFVTPLWNAELLNFDDNLYFGPDNAAFEQAYAAGKFGTILSPDSTIANAYLPVSHLSLFLDYAVVRSLGIDARLAHLHSLLLHVLAAFALARLLGWLGLARTAATVGAALFLVHPALVESVAWVSGRKDVLSGLFSFLCLGAVARHALQPRPAMVGWACGWALLAVYSKGTAVVLVLLAPLVVAVQRQGFRGGRWLAPLGVGVIALGAGLHHAWVASGQGTMQAGDAMTRLAQVPGAYLHYFATLLWPSSLNVLYPEVATLAGFRARFWVGLAALLCALGAAAWAWRTDRRYLAAGIGGVCLALLPFNTAWPASAIAAADRYLYLVVPALALAVVTVAAPQRLGVWVAGLAVVPLAWLAHERARDFETSVALWESSLAAEPENSVARLNLAKCLVTAEPARAVALAEGAAEAARYPMHRLRAEEFLRDLALQRGRFGAALAHAEQAAAAAGDLPPGADRRAWQLRTLLKLATLHLGQDQEARAREVFGAARAIAPDHPGVLTYEASMMLPGAVDEMGHVAADSSASQRARSLLDRALAAAPDSFEALYTRARWEAARGELMSALLHYQRARRLEPMRPETYLGEADLYISDQNFAGAESAVRGGLAAGVRDPNLLTRLGLALSGQGKLQAARVYYEDYLAMRPHDAGVRRALAAVIAADTVRALYQRAPDELEAAALRIQELEPNNSKALLIRGLAERLRRNLQGALVLLEQAFEAMPDSPDARRLLAETHRDRGYELLRRSPPPAAAMDHFRRFVDMAPPQLDTEAAVGILRGSWKRSEQRGVAAFEAGDLVDAEAAFRRCLYLMPEEPSARFQLGLTVLRSGGARLDEALGCFEKAEEGQRAVGLDASMPVLYQVLTLKKLGRAEEATARGRRYLENATYARTEVLERIRVAIDGG